MVVLPTILIMVVCLLVKQVTPQEALIEDLSPKINYINILAGSPTITITFKSSTLQFQTPLTNFWVKMVMPFPVTSLGPPIWANTTACCDFANMPFSSTIEQVGATSGNYTTVYVQLTGSTFSNSMTYVLQFVPSPWISQVGYTEYLRLSIVSENSTDAITYAYNNNFMNFFASEEAFNNLLLQDDTTDSNKGKVNQIIDSYLIVQIGYSTAQRIIVQTKGVYTFTSNANTTCAIVADASKGITAPDSSKVQCEFWESLGPKKRQSLVFIWKDSFIPSGKYKLKFQLNTPPYSGDHHLTILTMARYYPYILLKKEYDYIFSADYDTWETNFPKLFYSNNLDASNDRIQDEVGLYSMGLGYHKAFNSLRFQLRANTNIGTLATGESYSLDIYIGKDDAVLPLGYLYENFPLATGFAVKNITFSNGVLTISNIDIVLSQTFTVSFKVGFLVEGALPTDTVRGFGTCVLRKGSTVILKGRAKMRSRFNIVKFNPGLMTVESVDRNDNFKRRHRGFSAFRTENPSLLATANSFVVNTAKNGLRIGASQTFWFQSSLGPNPIYYPTSILSTHNGNRMFIDVITDPSIHPDGAVSYVDSSASSYCQVYSSVYSEWAHQITQATTQTVVNKYGLPAPSTASLTGTTSNFIGGCQYLKVTISGTTDTYSRFRVRFQDVAYVDANGATQYVRAKDVVLVDSNEIQTTAGAHGNYYSWTGITVEKFQSFKSISQDAVILDAFILAYMYAGTDVTTSTIGFPPEIAIMDNMYVLTSDDVSAAFPLSVKIYASIQHTWMYDSDPIANKWNVTVHDNSMWPVVLHIYGETNSLPANTEKLLIFFDFFEIVMNDKDTKSVGCSWNGKSTQGCKSGKGYDVLTEQIYRTVADNSGYSYITSRMNSFLQVDLLATQAAGFAGTFSLTIPVKPFSGQALSKLATLYQNEIVLNPGFVAVDSGWNVLEWVEFGIGSKSMKADTKAFSQSYEISSILASKELLSSTIKGLDDATANNNADNTMWVEPKAPTTQFTMGASNDATIKTICTGCAPFNIATNLALFSTGMICGNWDFGSNAAFSVNYNIADDRMKPHKISYLTTEGVKRFCLYIPNLLVSGGAANLDSSIQNYDVTSLTAPYYSGIKWPADTIGVISTGRILAYMKLQSLGSTILPNLISFASADNTLNLTQNYNSAKVDFYFQISNPLPKGGVIFFGITAGCENLLTVYGDNQFPPCYISVDKVRGDGSGTVMSCIYNINTGGFEIQLLQDLNTWGALADNNVKVTIYGLSIKVPTASSTCNFVVKSYLSISKNPLVLIDQTSAYFVVNYVTPTNASQPSGNLSITNSNLDVSQVTSYSKITYDISVGGRPIYMTDYISLSLGALKYDTTDDPVWCSVLNTTTGLYLPDFKKCIKNNLGLVGIKAGKDMSYSNVSVRIDGIINPISQTPGAVAEYYINEGFLNFNSSETIWSSLVDYGKFLNPVRIWLEFDIQGLKSDIFLSFIPDHRVNTSNVFYLLFSQAYLPILSKHSIYVSMMYKSPSSNKFTDWSSMKIWNIAPRMLAITGWSSSIPQNSNITMRIIGVENPMSTKKRVLQLTLGYEGQYSVFKQWGFASLPAAPTILGKNLINIENLKYNSLIIRESTKITISFTTYQDIPAGSYIMVVLNYIGDEIVKKFKPFCFLTKSTEFTSIAESCYMLGNRLEAQLVGKIANKTSYTFIIDDIPNPDFGYKEPEPISILIVGSNRVEVLSLSTEMIINYERLQFVKRDLSQLLDFTGITNGVLTVPQGYYSSVSISPIVIAATEKSSYEDEVTFALGVDVADTLISKPLSYLGISDFKARSGYLAAKLVVGAKRNAVLTTYPIQITKKEATGKRYTELPLLRVQVVPLRMTLQGISTIDVYIGSRSIPIKLSIDRVPTSPIKFDILFLSGNANGKLKAADLQQQFSLSETQMAFFLQLEAYDSTITPQTVPVTVRPVLSSSNFNDKVIAVNLIAMPASVPAFSATFNIPSTSTELYNFTFKVQSTQSSFIYYYAVPDYLYSAKTKDTVRAWALNGLSTIDGDISVGSIGIITLNTDQDAVLTGLIADTTYKLVAFIESTLTNNVEQREFTFSTKALTSKNAIMTLTFSTQALYDSRMKVLCIISRKYSLSLDTLWSGDGLNCDSTLIPQHVLKYHQEVEKEPISSDVKSRITQMEVLAFQSKREGQNSQGLTNLRTASVQPGAKNVFALYLNGVVRLSEMTPMGDFFETKPTLSTSSSTDVTDTSATIKGLTFTGVKGSVYAVAQKADEMADTVTYAEIRNVNSFNSYYWTPVFASPQDLTITIPNLKPNTDYKAAIVATSDDPRGGAASSSIVFVNFKTKVTGQALLWAIKSIIVFLAVNYLLIL